MPCTDKTSKFLPLQFPQSSRPDNDHRRLHVINEICSLATSSATHATVRTNYLLTQQHMPRVLGMYGLAYYLNVQPRPLEQASHLSDQEESGHLAFFLDLDLGGTILILGVLGIDWLSSNIRHISAHTHDQSIVSPDSPLLSVSITVVTNSSSPSLATVPIAHSTAYPLSSLPSLSTT